MKNLGSIDNDQSIITKGYGDTNYASSSDIATLTEQVRVANLIASDSNFKTEAEFRAMMNRFEYLCIESFEDTDDIDTTLDDGTQVVSDYYDATNRCINKTSSDTLTIQSRQFSLDSTPYSVLILVEYEGSGSVSLSFSKNNGEDWVDIENDTLTTLNRLVQKNVRVRIKMTGKVILKNIAWGCK